jgi:hypothetical protein
MQKKLLRGTECLNMESCRPQQPGHGPKQGRVIVYNMHNRPGFLKIAFHGKSPDCAKISGRAKSLPVRADFDCESDSTGKPSTLEIS